MFEATRPVPGGLGAAAVAPAAAGVSTGGVRVGYSAPPTRGHIELFCPKVSNI